MLVSDSTVFQRDAGSPNLRVSDETFLAEMQIPEYSPSHDTRIEVVGVVLALFPAGRPGWRHRCPMREALGKRARDRVSLAVHKHQRLESL